jgi:hypothetical protein
MRWAKETTWITKDKQMIAKDVLSNGKKAKDGKSWVENS